MTTEGSAIVRAAEPSVVISMGRGTSRAPGRGGRSCHLAALVGASLPRGAVFVAAATDGVDGVSGTGGAIVDSSFARRAGQGAIEDSVARFDTGRLHLALGTALPVRPTGLNLADLHILVWR
jgi:hydroxypyruvate reductase